MIAAPDFSIPPPPAATPASAAGKKTVTQLEDRVRENPGATLLLAAGLGLAVVFALRALNPPPPPKSRAVKLLEDIQQRLAELAHDGYDQITDLAEEGAHAASKGLGSLHLDRKIDRIGRALRNMFH